MPARSLLPKVAVYTALLALGALFAAPFALMLSTSLKAETQLFTPTMEWLPKPVLWGNYREALESFPFAVYLRNTILICLLTVIGTLLSCTLPAYAFSRLRWRGREALFYVVLATLMLPEQVTLLPVFLMFRKVGWTGTMLPLIVPPFFGNAFAIFLLRQFFLTIPQELSDAARIDGCSEAGILRRIILPLAVPAVATVALFAFIGAWTDFVKPLVYLTSENTYTLALGLQAFVGRHASQWNLLMAAATVVTLPLLALFLLTQRTFIEGVALTGVKG
jgi:multiple sugar transport system permease protein